MKVSNEWRRVPSEQTAVILKYQNEFPVKLGALAKELGVIVKSATLASNISGEIREIDGIVTIKVNRHDVKARQRYTLAHEIAHFLLHRELLANGIQDDVLYRSSQSNVVESEANRLAADILMPIERVNLLISKHSADKQKGALYEAVACDLGVSVIALENRLKGY